MRINNFNRTLTFWWTRTNKPRFRLDKNYWGRGLSDEPLDVVIPCLHKDLETLPVVVESIRKYLKHPIKKIYLVAPDAPEIRKFCDSSGCVFVDEKKAAPIAKNKINYRPNGVDRSGWLLQQLIKLSADKFVTTEDFMTWDADTAILKPQAYKQGRKYILNHSDEFHLPYFDCFERLMQIKARSRVSFIAHQMIMSKPILGELRAHIEDKSGKNWVDSILSVIDPSEPSAFSEYELYGNFLNSKHPRKFILDYWFNASLSRSELDSLDVTAKKHSAAFKSVSWHSYNEN